MDQSIQLDPVVIALLAGAVSPLLTALITHLRADSSTKSAVAITLVVLGAVAAVVDQTVQNNGQFEWKVALVLFFTTLASHAAAWITAWKPMSVNERKALLPNVGLGAPPNGQG